MRLSRNETGIVAVSRAYLSQVHPVFMLPPIAAAAFGAVLAGQLEGIPATLHVVAIFAAVYTAHLKDGYIDFHVRFEDDDHPLTARGCRLGIVGSSIVFFTCLGGLYWLVDLWAVLLTAPGWVIGYLHAPHLDTSPIGATVGYPLGIALAILGGYYVQVSTLSVEAIALGGIFLVLLSGVKIVDDLQDYDWDRAYGKRTVGVTLGVGTAHQVAIALMTMAVIGVVAFDVLGLVPRWSGLAAGAFLPVLLVARRHGPTVQTMLLIRGSYLFLAVLVAIAGIELIS